MNERGMSMLMADVWVELLRRAMNEGWRASQLESFINELKDQGGSAYLCQEALEETQKANRREWQKLQECLAYPEDLELDEREQLQRVRTARNELMSLSEAAFQRMDDALAAKEGQLKERLDNVSR